MVNLYTTCLLSLTLITSLALAAPYPRDLLLKRDLDEEFSGREYLSNAFDDLEARDPSFFGGIENAFKGVAKEAVKVGKEAVKVGKVAAKGLEVAEKIANNPMVQTASSLLPGGGEIVMAEKAIGSLGKLENLAGKVNGAIRTVGKIEGALMKGNNAIRKAKVASRNVPKLTKRLGGALGKVKAITRAAKKVVAPPRQTAQRRHHRRDLEVDDEELSRRDLDAEELFEREYDDDFLAERDFFDDLD